MEMSGISFIRLRLSWLVIVVLGHLLAVDQGKAQDKTTDQAECICPDTDLKCSKGAFLEINGICLYYEVHGQGDPILLMQGGGGSAEVFNRMLPGLTTHFQVITPDTRGRGRSTDTADPLSYRQFVEDMVGLLDALGIDSAFVGGYSEGAATAIHMAISYPDRVRALILTPVNLDAHVFPKRFWEDAERWNLPQKQVTFYRSKISPTEEEMASIRAPALIVIGTEEQYVALDHLAWQYETIPEAKVVWLEGADHGDLVIEPDRVVEAIMTFLQRVR
jgi:pimeloyl-ACP methyl ester carboxylesterase